MPKTLYLPPPVTSADINAAVALRCGADVADLELFLLYPPGVWHVVWKDITTLASYHSDSGMLLLLCTGTGGDTNNG